MQWPSTSLPHLSAAVQIQSTASGEHHDGHHLFHGGRPALPFCSRAGLQQYVMTFIAGDHACAASALIQRDGSIGVCGLQAGYHQAAISGCSGLDLGSLHFIKHLHTGTGATVSRTCYVHGMMGGHVRSGSHGGLQWASNTCTMGQQRWHHRHQVGPLLVLHWQATQQVCQAAVSGMLRMPP